MKKSMLSIKQSYIVCVIGIVVLFGIIFIRIFRDVFFKLKNPL